MIFFLFSILNYQFVMSCQKLPIPKNIKARTLITNLFTDGKILKKNGRLVCPYCPDTLKSRESLIGHIKAHLKEFKFFCKICNTGFLQKHHLTSHQRTNICSLRSRKSNQALEKLLSEQEKDFTFNSLNYQAQGDSENLNNQIVGVEDSEFPDVPKIGNLPPEEENNLNF